ncbi:TorF family putative porin [Halioxenophilus sp. WMMB6]|uniref:TorF family putative porin n=1 Tax=Halioxenophilus sp. WMMB6 TaxID=3073815 RepID=UPI00295E47F6|nr:TorF family putative porin [Halioxenophilus sp. WMMB6]
MKLAKTLLASAVAAAAISATAQAEISTNIAVASDYVWRGVTQTGYGAAVSGGIDYSNESGFFAGTWLSNTAFGSNEMDLYLGFGGEAGDFGYSVTYNYYTYPTIEDANFGEILLDFSFQFLSAGLSYTANSDVEEPGIFVEGDLHYYVGASFDLGEGWSIGGTYGFYDFDYDGDAAVGDVSYGYLQLDLGKSLDDWGDIAVSLSAADEESGEDDPIVWVSWSKGF